jgi:hypothetical protein
MNFYSTVERLKQGVITTTTDAAIILLEGDEF